MDQLLQCPVCTLFLHNGMSLENHLDTHPKDQVIKALCSLSSSRSNYGSRASTPMHSERSYRSRSRTPAIEDAVSRWSSSLGTDGERFWRKSNRTPKPSTMTRSNTPSEQTGDAPFDPSKINNGSAYTSSSYPVNPRSTTDKLPQQYVGPSSLSGFDSPYSYSQDQKEEKEIKYSRSAEYNSLHNPANNAYVYSVPTTPQNSIKMQNSMLPTTPQKRTADIMNMPMNGKQDFIKILPKSSNIALVKTNVGSMQYITPGVMVSAGPTYIPKNQHSLMAGNLQAATNLVQNKTITNSMTSNQLNQITSTAFAPNTTVVTQNSQIIYREMVHNIDGKPFIPGLPAGVLGSHENVTKVAQSSSLYQNVMLLDQFGNTSCMYAPPQLLPKPGPPSYSQNMASTSLDKNVNDPNKTLIIEVSPIKASPGDCSPLRPELIKSRLEIVEKNESEGSLSSKGLKILSNIKVEVPVQHNKNMLNKVVDLTGPVEREYTTPRPESPERILPDLDPDTSSHSASMEGPIVVNTFSVIKNVGNPPSYKETKCYDSKLHETESSDSCPVPDLTCNEKPSISPCSELTDTGDNSMPHASPSPKPEPGHSRMEPAIEPKVEPAMKPYKQNPLRLNNIFVKKSKKVLQIKNAKSFPIGGASSSADAARAGPSYTMKSPENFTVSKARLEERLSPRPRVIRLETVSIERLPPADEAEFDADTEERSMDLEPEYASPYTVDLTTVKIEGSGSGEARRVPYAGHFDDEDDHRELLDLETASKTKHLVSMMNDHYFGDNMYADYFNSEREGLDARVWGEGSRVPTSSNEFVLPNFIHESYKVADGEFATEAESKADLAPLDICADERMPPRGELSGQESNGDMEPEWNGMYPEPPPPEAYDLIARESWVSDASDADSNDKREHVPSRPARLYSCPVCCVQLPSLRELRAHRVAAHPPPPAPPAPPAHSAPPAPPAAPAPPYRGIIASGVIKKEERTDDVITGILQASPVAALASSMLEVYESMAEAKPKLEPAVKQEPKRRRRDYVCPSCKVDQLTDVAFHEHLKLHPLECLTCGKLFHRRANLALHMKTHLGIKKHKCELCDKRFITRQKLLEHFNVHTGRAPVRCTHCDRAFRRYSNMVQHRDRHHFNKKPKVRDFVCQCGEVYHSRAKLRWHRETHDARPKACPHCSDKFLHASSLTRHVRRMHNAYYTRDDLRRGENVACPICKQVYLRANLKTHLRTHSGKRPYSCVVCNKAFTTQWNLKLHRWTHMSRSSKPYKCSLCKGAFIRQSEYVSHMNAHKSVRPYTCNYCGCQFIRKYNCQRHVKEHETAKKYVCKVPDCGKTFHRSYYLSEHMKVHSGARPFSCSICGKTSSNKSNHNKHVKIHHAREPVATEA